MALLPIALREQIRAWAATFIWRAHLAPEGFENKPHITIKYGFKDSSLYTVQALRTMLCRHGPFPVTLKKLGLFKGNEDGDVLIIEIVSKELKDLNKAISSEFSCHDKYPTYKPHLTVAYLVHDCDMSLGYMSLEPDFLGKEYTIDEVEWSGTDGRRMILPLTGCAMLKAMSAYNELSGGALVGASYHPQGLLRRKIKPPRIKGNILRLVKSGFTGKIRDRLGRTQCYQQGMHVSCATGTERPQAPSMGPPAQTQQPQAQPTQTPPEEETPLPSTPVDKSGSITDRAARMLEEAGDAGGEIPTLEEQLANTQAAADKSATDSNSTYQDYTNLLAQRDSIKRQLELLKAEAGARNREIFLRHFGLEDKSSKIRGHTNARLPERVLLRWRSAKTFMDQVVSSDNDLPAVDIKLTEEIRSYYSFGTQALKMNASADVELYCHEYGHHIENSLPKALAKVKAFRGKRFDPKQAKPLAPMFPRIGFKPEEVGNPDDMEKVFRNKVIAWYSGVTYSRGDGELLSLGLEYLYKDPVHLARTDPEYFSLVMGVLQGDKT